MADSFTNKYLERKRQLTGNSTVTKRTTVPSKSTSSNNHAEGEAVSSSGQGRSSGTSGSSRSGSTDSFTSGYLRRKQELSRPSIAQIDPFDLPQFDSSILPDVSTPNKKASQTSPSRVQQAIQERNYSPLDRANDIIQGALRQWAGGIGSAVGNVLDRTTSRYNSDAADQWLDLVQDSMENRDDENYFERPEVQDRLENIRETREQTAPFIQEIYDIAEETGRQGTEQVEQAKEDLGPVGSFAVDVGTQVPQMLADAAFGAVTGGSALLPLGVRSYGYGVQEAMENGADRDQAAMYGVASGAKEALTEKLFSVALPFSRIYGGGSFDDAIQRGIQTAVERFASTPTGQRIVGGGLSLGASALTEGAEEFISDWLGWQMPRIYGGDVATAEETLSDSLYDFLVGAAVGGLGGIVSTETYNYQLPSRQGNTEVNSDTTTGMEAPESPGSVQNTAQNDSIPEATRRAVDLLVSGQEITGGQAERIARSPEAVALLSQLTGTEVNTDAPLSQVKADIRAVAGTRAASGTVSGQGQETAQTSQGTAPMVPQTERTTAQRVHDVNRVRGAASSMGMGESGQRAISAAYDGSVDADRYYAGFTAYYEAGLSGRARDQVRSDYAADLTEAQRFAAYAAGQNDATASLQREQAGVNYATVYGDEAGFLPSEHSANLSQETTRFYNVLAKATGTKITVTAATGESGANGWYRDGTIYISSDAQNAGEVVAMHEITHRLQEIAPEAYRKYRNYAVNALSEQAGSSAELVERYKSRYAASGVNLTTEEAMDEIAADFTQALTEDLSRFEALARDDRSVARKVLDAVRDFIRKVKRAISGRNRQNQAARETFGVDLDTLEQAARLWEDTLRAGRETTLQAGARDGRMGTTRNSLKEDGDHGRTREETRGAFLRRAAGAGYAVYEGETAAYGFRRAGQPHDGGNHGEITQEAQDTQRELTALGVSADIVDGPILRNRNGVTEERAVTQAVTVDRSHIFISKDATLFPRNIAGHEAFHLWKSGTGRDSYIEILEDNLLFSSEAFREYQTPIAEAYLGGEADLANDAQMDKMREEIFAYISGDIHEGTNEDALRPMFRDFDAVRAAWEQLVEENRGGTRYSLKSDSEALEELRSENDRLNRRIQELIRQVADLKRSPEFSNFENEVRNAQDGELDRIVARYTAWEEMSGLTAASRELEDLNRQARDVRRNLERARTEAARRAREEYRALYNEEFAKKYASKAARRFGTTSRFDLAGYLTVNGALLDFSQRQGYRVRDHREIAGVLDFLPEYAEYSDGMIEFMNLGNIRMQSYGIDISRAPNSKQRSVLRRFFNSLDGEVTVDFSRQDGGTDGSIDYPEGTRADRILNDIDHYFSTGVVPEQSMVSQFHTRYSLKVDSDGRALSQEQQDYFRDSVVRDDRGRLLVVYHGTPWGGFTQFRTDEGAYFTTDRDYAALYTRGDGEGAEIYEGYLNITNPFDTRNPRERQIFEDEFFGRWGNGTPLSEAGLPDWTDGTDLVEFLSENGYDYDGVIISESNAGSYTEESYVALSPEQFKRIDNRNPTDDPDIRRSIRGGSDILRENAALQEENASLRERVEYWRGQTRRTTPGQVDKKAVDRAARELIRDFDSTISAADISGDLLSLYNYMGTGREGNDELTYTEARRRADDIARRVVESAQVTENGAYQEYRALREYLRTSPLSISQEDAADIPDYSDFRRRNFGRLNLRGGDTNIDQVYQELSEMWPEFFDETRENNPVDQLLHISEVAEQLYRTTTGNPFAGNLREAQAGVSNEILERFFDIPQVRATFADRAAQAVENERQRGRERVNRVREQRDARIAQLREQNRERVQRAIQRERDTRERQLERLRNRYRARDTAGRERRTARELRARISRHVRDLSRRLLRPSDKQHIPEQLRTAVAAMLDAINLESVYTVDPETGRRQKGGEGDPTKRTEAFRQLRQAYSEITKDGADYTLVIDPDLMDNLDELAAMRNIPLAEMSIPQLTTVWDTVKAVEASVRTANKMLGQSRFQTISQVANGLKDDNILRQDRGDFKGILGRVDKLVNMDMLTPQSYFHRLGQTGDEMFRMLRTAQDRQIQIMHDAEQTTRDIIGKTDINKLERETHTFQVDGGTVTLSTAQIMSLYELMKREQAQEHIFTGGIRPETIPGQRGLRESRRSAPAHVTAENLAEMVGTLTDEQVEMADKLQQYMGGRLSELGNEASMEVYGYRKFTEPHYFPIQVDRNQTQRDISKEVQAQTIAGRGFTKSTAPRANNAVMVNSIFDVYASHVNDMATYAAWLPTMENVRRIRDFTFRDSEGNRTGTVKDIIERVFGRNGNPYLNKLVDDLNQGVRSTADPGLMDRIVGNYKAASVSANLRVILQQPTAILRALNTLDAKYLLAGTVKRGDWQKVKQYAPIAQWKDWGYFDINTGRQMKDVLFDSDTRLERLRQAGMAGASAADSFTWARLWNAVEAETKDRRKDLKPGTKEFYQAVGQRFSEIVDQTQVVDGVLQRSHIMRSPDGLTKMTTSFMGEPTKSYNMFLNAVYDLRHATGKESRRTARRALARTSVALAVSFTINAVMQSLVDGLRDDDKELDYWERVQRAFIGFSGDEESFLDYWNSFWSGNLEASYNPLSYMPYFKDLVSIIQGYDVSRMDAEALEKVFTSGKNFWQALNGEGRYSLAGASASFLAELSRLFGLPVANLKRDIQGTVTSAAIETDDYWVQYQIDKALLNIGYSGNRSGFMDILYAASVNDPEAYELIYDDMIASGITQEQIRTSMETRMREAQGVESVADLTRRYLTPDQERTYNRIYSQVTSSAIWSAANEEQREAVEDDLYDLAAGTDAGQRLQEKINGGASYGISDGDYLLYLAAREIADAANEDPEKRNGSIDQSEAEAAIDMLTGLSNEARAYLWQSTNKGWSEKNNPYR